MIGLRVRVRVETGRWGSPFLEKRERGRGKEVEGGLGGEEGAGTLGM